ncbi:unnamed protein product [Linum trigynum]
MHDLMHDLAISVAGEEIISLAISNSPSSHSDDSALNRVRHASMDFNDELSPEELMSHWTSTINKEKKLRTLFPTNQDWLNGRENLGEITYCNTTSLRMLDLGHFRMLHVSHTIHKLKHLRHLDLTENLMEMLPEEITELVNLEVLILEGCCLLKQLPRNTWKLSSLVHLGLDGCRDLTCMPRGIGQLCCLRELVIFRIAEGDTEHSSPSAGIGELQYLNNLRGSLRVENLKWVKNPCEGKSANLGDKKHLEKLELSWESWGGGSDVSMEGELLEALHPHPNLKLLHLRTNAGLNCPSWLPSLTSLVEIQIVSCKNWKRLLPLDHLPALTKLELSNMESLEWIESSVPFTSQLSSPSSFFPSLKSLKLERCPNLKGWLIPAESLPEFACASEVDISECNSIMSIPCFSPQLQSLELSGGSKDMLKHILRMPSASLPNSPPPSCSHFEDLYLHDIDDLDTLPEEILPRFSSLKTLSISGCCHLSTLYPSLPYCLDSLEKLKIENCRELDLFDVINREDAAQVPMLQQHDAVLTSLSQVTFEEIPKLISLPEWLQFATSLKCIEIADCPVTCMPEWIPNPTHLRDLTIFCYNKTVAEFLAENFTKVAHISRVQIDDTMIMIDGRFNEDWADNGEYEEEKEEDEEEEDDDDEEEDDDNEEEEDDDDEGEEEDIENETEQVTEGKEVGEEEATSKLGWFLTNCAMKLTKCCSVFLRCFEGSSSRS